MDRSCTRCPSPKLYRPSVRPPVYSLYLQLLKVFSRCVNIYFLISFVVQLLMLLIAMLMLLIAMLMLFIAMLMLLIAIYVCFTVLVHIISTHTKCTLRGYTTGSHR
jgi:hypothetical protein